MNNCVINGCRYWLGAFALLLCAATSHAANDYIVAPSGGDITGAELSAQLAAVNVTLNSSSGSKAGAGNIIINDTVTWSANNKLTMNASNNVIINSSINASGATAGMVISPNTANGNEQSSGTGSYSLGNGASITLSGTSPTFSIGDSSYTVINSLGAAVDATTSPAIMTLQGMAATANLTKNFVLGNNIDASLTSTWNSGKGFTPIGNSNTKFTGNFDGLGHTISNLSSIRPGEVFVGLFGYVGTSSTLRNIGVVGGNTKGEDRVGNLVGENLGTVSNAYASGVVQGSNNVGGLIGVNRKDINNSYSNATVKGTGIHLGGLVGASQGTIRNSYAVGSMSGSSDITVGGLVGYNCNNNPDCLSAISTIANSYAAVSGTINGLVGLNQGAISNSYCNKTISNNCIGTNSGTGAASGLPTLQMQTMSNFNGWDIANTGGSTAVWRIYEGSTYPLLRSFLTPITLTPAYDGTTQAGFSDYRTNIANPNTGNILGSASGLTLNSTATAGSQTTTFAANNFYSNQQGYDISLASRTATGTGAAANDLNINAPLSWNAGTLTLNAQNNININASLTATSTGSIVLQYGQGAVAAGNQSDYRLNNGAQINLPAGTTNFTTKLGSDSKVKTYTVITVLGSATDVTTPPTPLSLQGMAVSANLSGNYALGGDIDACATGGTCSPPATPWNSGAGFTPIGNSTNNFTGTFAGLGHAVNNLMINMGSIDNVGLFGYTGSGSTILDVGLTGGNVTGQSSVGILAGNSNGMVINSYVNGSAGNMGSVQGAKYVGGLVGQNNGTLSNSHYDVDTVTINGGNNVTLGGLYNTNGTGQFADWLQKRTLSIGNYSSTLKPDGNNYDIDSAQGLKDMLGFADSGSSFVLSNDIDLSQLPGLMIPSFTGTFNGNNHVIKSLSISLPNDNIGLFGKTSSGSNIQYLGLTGGSVSGNNNVGSLVGSNGGTIVNSYSAVNVSAAGSQAGGLVGVSSGSVSNSYSAGSITGNSSTNLGGLVGQNSGNSNISNSYASGAVSGGSSNIGGLVGNNSGTVANSFWDKTTSGPTTGIGSGTNSGATGISTADMQRVANFTSPTSANGNVNPDWSITKTGGRNTGWRIYEGSTYPLLRSFLTPVTLTPVYDGSRQTFSNIADYTSSPANPNTNAILFAGLTLKAPSAGGSYTATLNASSNQQGYDITSTDVTIRGSQADDLNINLPLTWSTGTLILKAQGNININADLTGAAVVLHYGQSGDYKLNNGSKINLPAGKNFATQQGSNISTYTVITALGNATDAITPPTPLTLQGMAASANMGGNYALGSDIDASATSGWNSKAGLAPIGSSASNFTGTFAGLGHAVSNLSINMGSTDNVGLFGYTVSGSTIRDVGLTGGNITGQNSVGGLVGYNGGAIRNSFATQGNKVTGVGGSGGLVGTNSGSIANSHTSGTVIGIDDVGGLVGVNSGRVSAGYSLAELTDAKGQAGGLVGTNTGEISNSYASGQVGAAGKTGEMGGLVGLNNGAISYSNALGRVECGDGSSCGGLVGNNSGTGTIDNSYATGGVAGTATNAGGLVGINSSTATPASITASYATGNVVGQTNVGGLIGNNSGTISNGYWNSSAKAAGIGTGSSSGATGLTAAQMLVSSNFSGFNITNTPSQQGWVVVNTDGSLQIAQSGITAATSPMLATEYSTSVNNSHQLQLMLINLGANYKMDSDVDAIGTGNGKEVWGLNGFMPIGNATNPFTGNLNGQYHILKGLYISQSEGGAGLFGKSQGGVFLNLGLINSRITGKNDVGGLAGNINGGNISNCYVNGYVSGYYTYQYGTGDNIGGLVGYNNGSIINNSSAIGIAYGGRYVGGLVGYNNSGKISNSYASTNVNARNNCAGGLVGYNVDKIDTSYSRGGVLVKAGGSSGGLAAYNQGTVTNSYWDVTTSNQSASAGGTGLSDAQMKQQSSFSGWDFANTWDMKTYPALLNMPEGYTP